MRTCIARGSQIAAALALGAEGVWCGTIWLATRADDAVRSRVRTGKPVRMVRSRMSEAWEKPGAPGYQPTPLQGILYNEIHARVVRAQRPELCSFPVGQAVGSLTEETSVREVMLRLQTEYRDTMDRMIPLAGEA